MRSFFFLLFAIAVIFFFRGNIFDFVQPTVELTPPPPRKHLAPAGTFYMVDYVSMRTPHGITGFPPGEEVRFVSADPAKRVLVVANANGQVEVTPMQLTNDLDVAAMARRHDEQSQHALYLAQENARQFDERTRQQVMVANATDVSRTNTGSVIGTGSKLDEPARQVGYWYPYRSNYYNSSYYGNPYSYLYR